MYTHRFALSLCCVLALQIHRAHAEESWTALDGKGMLDVLAEGYELKAVAGGQTAAIAPNGVVFKGGVFYYVFIKGTDVIRCEEYLPAVPPNPWATCLQLVRK